MAHTKFFKIGEYAVGGIIHVSIKGKVIRIAAADWHTSKEIMSGTVLSTDGDAVRKLTNFLNELTSSYYADKVLDWIKSKVELKAHSYFSW